MVQRAAGEAGSGAVLADVKAVAAGLSAAQRHPARRSRRGPKASSRPASRRRGEAWPDVRLAQRLGVKVGDRLAVGESTLTVGAIVQQEPEVASGLLAIGPRLLVNLDDVPATNLLQPGNRATYRLLVADAGNVGAARCVRRLGAERAEAGPAARERARPAAGSAADARTRRAVSRPGRARRRDSRRRRRGARRVALPAPASRHRGDAALPRRVGAADARAVRAAVRGARRAGERRGRRAGARRPAAAGDAARHASPPPTCRRPASCRRWPRSAPACCCCSASRCRRWWRSPARRRCACCGATCRGRARAASPPTCSAWR